MGAKKAIYGGRGVVVSRTLAHLGVAFVSGGLLQAYGRTISLSLYIFFHYHCPEICVYEREKEIVQYMDIHKNYKKTNIDSYEHSRTHVRL